MRSENAPPIHDRVLSFVLESLRDQVDGLEVLRTDTRDAENEFAELKHCPDIDGYRPDAFCIQNENVIMVEVKSAEDFNSKHSANQFSKALRIISTVESWFYLVVVFGRFIPQLSKSDVVEELNGHPRFSMHILKENGGSVEIL